MKPKQWFVIENVYGRINVLTGMIDDMEQAISMCKILANQGHYCAQVAETCWG